MSRVALNQAQSLRRPQLPPVIHELASWAHALLSANNAEYVLFRFSLATAADNSLLFSCCPRSVCDNWYLRWFPCDMWPILPRRSSKLYLWSKTKESYILRSHLFLIYSNIFINAYHVPRRNVVDNVYSTMNKYNPCTLWVCGPRRKKQRSKPRVSIECDKCSDKVCTRCQGSCETNVGEVGAKEEEGKLE